MIVYARSAVAASRSDELSYLELVRAHSVDAVAFQGLGRGMSVWIDHAEGARDGAVAYLDTGGAWVAAGGPVAPLGRRGEVAARFVLAARSAGRRAVFFGVEPIDGLSGWPRLHLGVQPSTSPAEWRTAVARTRSLREQLRRARAKGVRVTLVSPSDLSLGAPLRAAAVALVDEWVLSRRIEPMGFLVEADPFVHPEEHRYVMARQDGRLIGLLSVVPAYAGRGWLVEHLVCSRGAPNGTGEAMLDALHSSLVAEGRGDDRVSLGLAPLAGDVGSWQRVVRFAARPLFDFHGLHDFKSRLRPTEWRKVWLVVPPRRSRVVALFDSLSAFARGRIVTFALRSLLFHPQALLWSLSMGLGAWAAVLLGLLVSHRVQVGGCSDAELLGRLLFRACEAVALLLVARRPSSTKILLLAVAAAADGVLATLPARAVAFFPPEAAFRVGRVAVSAATIVVLFVARREWRRLQADRASLRMREVA